MELSLSLLGAMDTPLPVSVAVFSVLFIVWALLVVPTGDGDDDDDMDTEEEESSDDGMDVEQGIGGATHPSGDLGMLVPPAAAAAAAPVQPTENNLPTAAAATGRTRQVYSIAHTDMLAGKVVYIHVDLEHTGVHVCQLSAVITDANGTNLGTFDEYVRPPAHEWNTTGCEMSHGYKSSDAFIKDADPIEQVWPRFTAKIESYLDNGNKVGMLIAWSGKGGDCGKLFEITEELHKGVLNMPRWVVYFCDPITCISHYTSCQLNESKRQSGRVGYGLGLVYEEAFGEPITNAHNSLRDAEAQAKIVCDARVRGYIDRTKSVVLMKDVWAGKRKQAGQHRAELTRAVPLGWDNEGVDTFELPREKSYAGPGGGGQAGPSSAVTRVCSTRSLADLFLFFVPLSLLETVAREAHPICKKLFMPRDRRPQDAVIRVPCCRGLVRTSRPCFRSLLVHALALLLCSVARYPPAGAIDPQYFVVNHKLSRCNRCDAWEI